MNKTEQIVNDARLIIDAWELQYFNDTRKQYRDAKNFCYYQSEIIKKITHKFKNTPVKQHYRYINDLVKQINFMLEL